MMKSNISIFIVFCMYVFFAAGCDKKKNELLLSDNYEVIDSGLSIDGRSINWMDDHRIITYAINPAMSSKGKIYIWDITNNQITEYSNGGPPCYSDGYIYYSFKTDLNLTKDIPYGAGWKEGEMGSEKIYKRRHRKGEGKLWHRNNKRNKFDCKLVKRPIEMENRIWVPLLEKHGYLDFGKIGYSLDEALPVFLVAPGQEPKQLTFTKNQVGLTSGIYNAFNNSYFFWPQVIDVETRNIWKRNGCLYGWWINPDSGDTSSECVPSASWTGSPDFIPTRPGLFMTHYNYNGADPEDSGGYLYKNKEFKYVIRGEVTGATVSPDGCSIAMAHRFTYFANKNEKLTLKTVNICK